MAATISERCRLGVVLRHITSGDVAVLGRRKEDDSGWWVSNGGGLADSVIETDWEYVAPALDTHLESLNAERRLLVQHLRAHNAKCSALPENRPPHGAAV